MPPSEELRKRSLATRTALSSRTLATASKVGMGDKRESAEAGSAKWECVSGTTFVITHLDDRKLAIKVEAGEIIRPGDCKVLHSRVLLVWYF